MIFTLHRYIFREVFRVFILATLALTIMLSLGSIIEPVQKHGVGPAQVIDLMIVFLPITLTFVLPMAALFAASLVYGRFAGDNELDACRASGISMLALVYPGLLLAVIVAIANLILSFHVMPAFVQRAETSIKADAKNLIFRNIQRRGYYQPKDRKYLIYADHVDPKNNTLSGVIITEIEKDTIGRIITTEQAKIKFNPDSKLNQVQIAAVNTYEINPEYTWHLGFSSFVLDFPPLMGDNIKFKKISDMKKIKYNPMLFDPIAKAAGDVYAQFTAELLAVDIASITGAQTTADDNPIINLGSSENFYKLHSGRKLIEFTAGRCLVSNKKEVELSGRVTVIEYDMIIKSNKIIKKRLRQLQSEKVLLHIEGQSLEPTLTMYIYSPNWQYTDGRTGISQRKIFRGLIIPKNVFPETALSKPALNKNITEQAKAQLLLESISPEQITALLGQKGPGPKLKELRENLSVKIRKTLIEITAEKNSRLVFGIGCVPLIMIGIGLGIIKKGGHLLSAFGASSIPAAVLIVCIMSGKQLTKNPSAGPDAGIVLMWIGVVILSVLALMIYRRLLKN